MTDQKGVDNSVNGDIPVRSKDKQSPTEDDALRLDEIDEDEVTQLCAMEQAEREEQLNGNGERKYETAAVLSDNELTVIPGTDMPVTEMPNNKHS